MMLEEAVVGIAQWLPTPGRSEENLNVALSFVAELGRAGCDVIVLPELWPSGFDWLSLTEDVRSAAEPLDGPRTRALARAARSTHAWLCAGTVPELVGGTVYNTLLLFDRTGELRARHRKTHLYEPLGESKAVAPGNEITICRTEDFGEIGLSICFEGDFPEVARAMALRGAHVVLHPSAYELGAERWWDVLYPAHALANGQWWIMADQCGTNRSGTLLGGSQIISPFGTVVARAGRAAAGESPPAELLVASVRLREDVERADAEHGVLWKLRRADLYAEELDGSLGVGSIEGRSR